MATPVATGPGGADSPLTVDASGNLVVALSAGHVAIGTVAIDQTTPGTTNRVFIANDGSITLLAGSAVIGKVGIDQSTPGTTNKVSIGADGIVQLAAGSAVVGKFGIDQTTPGTTNKVSIGSDGVVAATQSGTWTVQPGNTANTTPWLTRPGQSVYTTLLAEALPSVTTSAQIFANAPAGTKQIWLTIRTAPLTIRTDGNAATAGGNGLDFLNDSPTPYVFDFNQAAALLVRAIQNGGTATGWIAYRG